MAALLKENVWLDKNVYDLAEKEYYEKLAKPQCKGSSSCQNSKSSEKKQCYIGLEKDENGVIKIHDRVWFDKSVYDLAEKQYYEKLEKNRLSLHGKDRKILDHEVDMEEKVDLTPSKDELTVKNKHNQHIIKDKQIVKDISVDGIKNKTLDSLSQEILICNKTEEVFHNPKRNINELNKNENYPQPIKKELTNKTICPSKLVEGKQMLQKITDIESPVISSISKPNATKKECSVDLSAHVKLDGIQEVDTNKLNKDLLIQEKVEQKIQDSPCVENETNNDDSQTKKETKKPKRKKNKKKRPKEEKGVSQNSNSWNLAGEVAKARHYIQNSLQCIDDIASITSSTAAVEVNNRINNLEKENADLKTRVKELTDMLAKFEIRIGNIEKKNVPGGNALSKCTTVTVSSQPSRQPCDDVDDGVDLFASDSEEESAESMKIKEQRLAEYAAKKSKKPGVIAKSSIVLDVKPWEDTTNMAVMEQEVRKISTDGLLWGASKLVPLAYGIHKLQISCVVEDEKVSVDWLQETIEFIEDYVQSVDIAAFNKI